MTTSPSKRTIVIGDIHGCYEELLLLLDKIQLQDKDEIISIGDLVDRGPKSKEVVQFFMKHPQASAIMGNHEDKHIRIFDKEFAPSLSQKICIEEFGDFWKTAVEYFRTLPLYLYRAPFWLVHAGMLPRLHPKNQPRNALLRAKMPWMKNNYDKSYGGWWKYYKGAPVVFGHSVFNNVHIENQTFGIDTGACHGKQLSAIILEERAIVQVSSAKDYWKEIREEYRQQQELLQKRE